MKLWGGRFDKNTAKAVDDFNASIAIDSRMYRQDIEGSKAHAAMLGSCGIIAAGEAEAIINGLDEILADIEAGKAEFSVEAEDIHMNIESLLIAKIGDTGKKLHTARSRNDQVNLDLRLYLKQDIHTIQGMLKLLLKALLDKAEENVETIMPGYTHLQKAQPVTMGHHFMAYFEMFKRDAARFSDCLGRVDLMTLGSCALAGTTYPLNRDMVAKALGFSAVSANSMDGVSDRDFAVEFISCCAIFMMHMSRFCEEIIIWNTSEFGYIEMDDAYSTGSSIMPQKKNPDVAELIRGKTGRVYGDLMALLTVMKGLPLAYNKDMQEDKEAVFDAGDTVKACMEAFVPMFLTMKVKKEQIRQNLKGGFLNATDAADYLAAKGVPFRSAHEISGRMVSYCILENKELDELSPEEFKKFSEVFEPDIYDYIALENCVERRSIAGGPAKSRVLAEIEKGKKYLHQME